MKTWLKPIRISMLIGACSLLLIGCKDKTLETYVANVPIYKSVEDWRAETCTFESPRNLKNPGKIYFKDDYVLVNEMHQGIHVIDNSNPASPQNIGFIPILANLNMAMSGNMLYADSYYDLITIDLSNPTAPIYADRDEDVFEFWDVYAIEGFTDGYPIAEYYSEKGIVVGWTLEEVTVETNGTGNGGYLECGTMDVLANAGGGAQGINSVGPGYGGSMARFTVFQNHLYILEQYTLESYSLTDASDPTYVSRLNLNRNCETIFPAEENIFIGTTTGMLIYGTDDPGNPNFVGEFDHITSCDPVAVYGGKAYVTLSSGNMCWNMENQLDVIDLTDMSNPTLIQSYPMTNPKGLGLDNNTLFLCDGDDGLKVFDITDSYTIDQNQLSHFPNINTYDVIPVNGNLLMIGNDGLYQYDYSDINNVTQISVIPVTP